MSTPSEELAQLEEEAQKAQAAYQEARRRQDEAEERRWQEYQRRGEEFDRRFLEEFDEVALRRRTAELAAEFRQVLLEQLCF